MGDSNLGVKNGYWGTCGGDQFFHNELCPGRACRAPLLSPPPPLVPTKRSTATTFLARATSGYHRIRLQGCRNRKYKGGTGERPPPRGIIFEKTPFRRHNSHRQPTVTHLHIFPSSQNVFRRMFRIPSGALSHRFQVAIVATPGEEIRLGRKMLLKKRNI